MRHEQPRAAIQPILTNRPRRWAHWVGKNWARLTYGRRIEPTWLELTSHSVGIANLPTSFHGFRIVHLSDLHIGKSVSLPYLDEAVGMANQQSPDLIALTGDFIHQGYRYIERVATAASQLRAREGIVAVLGNHDFAVRNALGIRLRRKLHHAVERALHHAGVHVLRNRALHLHRGEGQLHVIGVDDLWSGACDLRTAFAGLSPHTPRLLLAHNPRTVEHLRNERCDLILSGHTHGGQINWPGVGRFLLGKRGQRFAAGMYRYHSSYLYVNRGVGHGFRFRFGARPEVAVIELTGSDPAPEAEE